MTAREYLCQLWECKAKIDARLVQIRELRDRAMSIKAVGIREDIVQTSHDPSPLENAVIKYLELEIEVAEDIIELSTKQAEIISQIHAVSDPRAVTILYKRYAELKDWGVVAKEIDLGCVYARHMGLKAEELFVRANPSLGLKISQKNTE